MLTYEHTRGLMWMDNANGLLIPDFLLGVGQTGTMSMIGPWCCLFAAFAIERFWSSSRSPEQNKAGSCSIAGAGLSFVPFLLVIATFSNGFHFLGTAMTR